MSKNEALKLIDGNKYSPKTIKDLTNKYVVDESTAIEAIDIATQGYFEGKNFSSRLIYKGKDDKIKVWLTGSGSVKGGDAMRLHVNIVIYKESGLVIREDFWSDNLQKLTLEELLTKADNWATEQFEKLSNQ